MFYMCASPMDERCTVVVFLFAGVCQPELQQYPMEIDDRLGVRLRLKCMPAGTTVVADGNG